MASGPCLCGDPYCAFCGNPQAAAMEAWIDHLCEITADFDEEQARIFETVGMAAVKAHNDAQKAIRQKQMGEWKEPSSGPIIDIDDITETYYGKTLFDKPSVADVAPRTRPIQGGWLEKDTLTGEVHEPVLQRREEQKT